MPGIFLAFAIPDHPWTDASDGAAVRIAMTVGTTQPGEGQLMSVMSEATAPTTEGEGVAVTFEAKTGVIHADLNIGPDLATVQGLQANGNLSNRGVQLFGAGFIVTPEQANDLCSEQLIRDYRNGRDLTDRPRGVKVIDAFGLTLEQLRDTYPAIYQWLLERVKPERDSNNRESRKNNWWLFGEPNPKLRRQLYGLPRYIVTVETAKHRTFQFLDASILPDNMLVAIAMNDAAILSVLSSLLHVTWALATGARLGVGNDPRYNKTRCFETFPFPILTSESSSRLAGLGERLDMHRKRQQERHPELTLTGCYNVLNRLRSNDSLNAKERVINEQGLCSILKELHDAIDREVLTAYGWSDLRLLLEVVNGNSHVNAPADRRAAREALTEALLSRLAALNAQRAAEESEGLVRWLRPELQSPQILGPPTGHNATDIAGSATGDTPSDRGRGGQPPALVPWPETMAQRIAALGQVLTEAGRDTSLSLEQIAERFQGLRSRRQLPDFLETLVTVGRAVEAGDGRWRLAA